MGFTQRYGEARAIGLSPGPIDARKPSTRFRPTHLGPYAGVISALATAATAVIAIVALGSTARDSRERSRPMIFAMFREAEHSDSSFDLVVKNFGTSAARDLVVEFDPPLTEEERKDELTDFVAKRYDNPIPLLPPGSELTNTWWGGGITPGGGNEVTNQLNTPDEVAVSVSYKGNRFRRYCDKFTLSADTIKLKTYSVSSTSMPGRMKTIAEVVEVDRKKQTKATNSLIHRHRPSPDRRQARRRTAEPEDPTAHPRRARDLPSEAVARPRFAARCLGAAFRGAAAAARGRGHQEGARWGAVQPCSDRAATDRVATRLDAQRSAVQFQRYPAIAGGRVRLCAQERGTFP